MRTVLALALALSLAGCASKKKAAATTPIPPAGDTAAPGGGSGAPPPSPETKSNDPCDGSEAAPKPDK